MTKLQFLLSLNNKLSGLPQGDIEERLNFYSEMIEDRIEEGLSEADAVAAVGSVDEIVTQIIADNSPKKTTKKTQRKAWGIVLLVLGSPIWLSLLIAAFAVVLSLYASLWAVIISLWAVFASCAGCSAGGIIAGIGFVCSGNRLPGIAMIGAGIFCAGLAILFLLGCRAATKGALYLTKRPVSWLKGCFVKKENT